jgi:hypothetical protein
MQCTHCSRHPLLLTTILLTTHAQPCACPSTFDWMVRTFEE